jgi:hypothetical protein
MAISSTFGLAARTVHQRAGMLPSQLRPLLPGLLLAAVLAVCWPALLP